MYIEDLDEAVMLRNHLRQFERLKKAAESGSLMDFKIAYEGDKIDVWSVIGADFVRRAIMAACDNSIAETQGKLGDINVNTAQKLRRAS